MGLRVNTNIASLNAQRHMANVTNRIQGNYSRLASGLRIASAMTTPPTAISERMRSQIRSFSVAARNAQDGLSLAQTAEGALGEVSNILSRMRELAMQSSNGTLSNNDRATIDAEFDELKAEISRIATETEFNGTALLEGTNTAITVQVGIDAGETIQLAMVDVQRAPRASTSPASTALSRPTRSRRSAPSTRLSTPQRCPRHPRRRSEPPVQHPALDPERA